MMRAPDNWHIHGREGKFMDFLVKLFIQYGWRRRVVFEPNLTTPILNGNQATEYFCEIMEVATRTQGGEQFEPVMTIQITETTTAETIRKSVLRGIRVCKVYPRYVTTNSEHGVVDYTKIYPALAEAEKLGLVVQFHPEHPSYDVEGGLKELAFIGILHDIVTRFPRLRISVEHVSSQVMVEWVKAQSDNVGAGIAVHYLFVTEDDLRGYSRRSGGKICVDDAAFKPCAKKLFDLEAIREVILSGHPRFWYGGDDAWHLSKNKHCSRCACGAGNTLATLPLLIELFKEHGVLEKLEAFVSEHGACFYGFSLNRETMVFVKEEWLIPTSIEVPGCNDVVTPFFAGEMMHWRISS